MRQPPWPARARERRPHNGECSRPWPSAAPRCWEAIRASAMTVGMRRVVLTPAVIGPAPSVRAVPRPPGWRRGSGHSWTSPPATGSFPCRQRSVRSHCTIHGSSILCCFRLWPRRCRRLPVIPSPEAPRWGFSASCIPGARPYTLIPIAIAWGLRGGERWMAPPGSPAPNASFSPSVCSAGCCGARA